MTHGIRLDNVEIQAILPHRYPFLLVDRIEDLEVGKRANRIIRMRDGSIT